MFSLPTDPEDPLARLHAAGYDLTLRDGHLLVGGLPYLSRAGLCENGRLVLAVSMADGVLRDASGNHTIWFAGEEPLDSGGAPLSATAQPAHEFSLNEATPYQLSFKPGGADYSNLHDKVVFYSRLLERHARTVDPSATCTRGGSFEVIEDGSPFVYTDTNTARAGLVSLNQLFKGHKVAIIGVGGTGSYILDQIAKTSVDRILVVDGDVLESHNAFRAPGAASRADVAGGINKAVYFTNSYSRMHAGISAEPNHLTSANLGILNGVTFAFLAAADASERPIIITALAERGIPFIDVGMSFTQGVSGALTGMAKTRLHLPNGLPARNGEANQAADDYGSNIQVADLNALNAQLAVILWKKHLGFYASAEPVADVTYKLFLNRIRNGEAP